MSTTTTSVEVTRTSTTQEAPLGFIVREPQKGTTLGGSGERVWIYVQTEDALTEGRVCQRKDATLSRIVVLSAADAPAQAIVGVAQHTIADNSFGFILRQGIGEVLAGTETIDVNEPICASADSGDAQEVGGSATDGYRAFGYATENAANDALATCWIDCRG